MSDIAAYICVGDSMSIDEYPYYELREQNPQVAQGVGAASLLYRNIPEVWPAFHKDLSSAHPGIKFVNLAHDGAVTFDYLEPAYLELVHSYKDEALLVTLTIGGNDLRRLLRFAETDDDRRKLRADLDNLCQRFDRLVTQIPQKLPRAICIFNSVYDPSDGTGELEGLPNFEDKLPLLKAFNDFVAETAVRENALFADVHKHFLGHGAKEPDPKKRWYWTPNPIEPSARGASELRRLWLIALLSEGLVS